VASCSLLVYRVYKRLQNKNTKLYTFEKFYQFIAFINPVFELEMRFLGGFLCAILHFLRKVDTCVNRDLGSETGIFLPPAALKITEHTEKFKFIF
jgi:hypothetical protein